MISRKALEAEAVPSNVNCLAINFYLRHAALAAHIPRNGGIVARRYRLGRIDRAVTRAVAAVAAVNLGRHGISLAGHIGLGSRRGRRIIGIRRSNGIFGELNHDVHVGRQGALHLVGALRNQVVAHHAINHHLGDMAAICCLPRHRRLRALLLLQRRRNGASSRTLRSHVHVQVAVVVQAQLQHGTAGNRTFKHVVRAIRIEPVGRTFIGDLRLLVHFGYRNRLLGRSCIRLGKGGHRAIHRITLGVLRARVVQVTHRIVGIIARRPFGHKGVVRLLEHIALAVGRRIGQRVFARLLIRDGLQVPTCKIVTRTRGRGELSKGGRRISGRCGSRVSDVVHAATTSGVKRHDELVRVILPHSVQRQIMRGHRGSRTRRSRRARRHLDGIGVIVHGVLGG